MCRHAVEEGMYAVENVVATRRTGPTSYLGWRLTKYGRLDIQGRSGCNLLQRRGRFYLLA